MAKHKIEELWAENAQMRELIIEMYEALVLADKFVSWTPQQRTEANWGPYSDIKSALELYDDYNSERSKRASSNK